jgi:hypothetical protein
MEVHFVFNPQAISDRIETLRTSLNNTKSSTLRDLYVQAIRLTEDASWRVLRLFESAEVKHAEDAELAANRHDSAMKQLASFNHDLAEIESNLKTQGSDVIRASELLRLEMIKIMLAPGPFELHTALLDHQATERIRNVALLAEQLTKNILAPDQGKFVFKTAVEGINFAIGLIPYAGNVYSALLSAYAIGTDRSKKEKNADEVACYLEEYCNAIRVWMAAADGAIRVLSPIEES